MPKKTPKPVRAAVTRSEKKRRDVGGVPVRSSARWLHRDYADEARERINAAADEIVADIIARHPDAEVSARDADE